MLAIIITVVLGLVIFFQNWELSHQKELVRLFREDRDWWAEQAQKLGPVNFAGRPIYNQKDEAS
jgi:hypothetical protein